MRDRAAYIGVGGPAILAVRSGIIIAAKNAMPRPQSAKWPNCKTNPIAAVQRIRS